MKIKVTTPEQKAYNADEVICKVVELFERELRFCTNGLKTYDLFIDGCYIELTRKKIEALYKQAGWKTAVCELHPALKGTCLKLEK